MVWEGKVLILQQIISIPGEASMSSCTQTGLRENLIYGATPPPRRVWTRSALKAVKLLTEISASSNDSMDELFPPRTIWNYIAMHNVYFCIKCLSLGLGVSAGEEV